MGSADTLGALTQRYLEDPHVIEVAQRVHKVEEFVSGVRSAMTYERVLHEVAQAVAMWKTLDAGDEKYWHDKPVQDRRLHGYFEVTAGPHDGWSISVRVGNIYDTHLSTFFDEARARQKAKTGG